MPNKRKYEQELKDSENEVIDKPSVTKRLNTSSRFKMEDLPLEILEKCLIKAIVLMVKHCQREFEPMPNVLLKKITVPLRTVCSIWDHCLTTRYFKIVLRRATGFVSMKLIKKLKTTDYTVQAITKVENSIYVLYYPFPEYDNRYSDKKFTICTLSESFNYQDSKIIEIRKSHGYQTFMTGSLDGDPCLYITDVDCMCIWKVSLPDYHTKVWIPDFHISIQSVFALKGGQLLVLDGNKELKIYGPDANLIRTVTSSSLRFPYHAVQTMNGDFIVIDYENRSPNLSVISRITGNGEIIKTYCPTEGPYKLDTGIDFCLGENKIWIFPNINSTNVLLLDLETLTPKQVLDDLDPYDCTKKPYIDTEEHVYRHVFDTFYYDCTKKLFIVAEKYRQFLSFYQC